MNVLITEPERQKDTCLLVNGHMPSLHLLISELKDVGLSASIYFKSTFFVFHASKL